MTPADYPGLSRRVDAVESRVGLLIAAGEMQRDQIEGLRTDLAAVAVAVDSIAGELTALGQVADDLTAWRDRREDERGPARGPAV